MEPRGLMGGFYRISEWIMRLAVINLLWLVCSLPFVIVIVFILFLYLPDMVNNVDLESSSLMQIFFMPMVLVGIVAPFTLFPATAAMFTVARKWVLGESDVALFKTFFRGYKDNYKQAMLGGILYTILFIILIVDFFVYREQMNVLSYIFIAFLVLLAVSVFNYFSMLAHYHMKTFQLLKNAVLITIGKPFRSLSTAIMCGVVIYVSFFVFTFLIPFFMGSIIAFLAFWNFNIIYTKLQEQVERMRKSEEEEAEEAAELDREDLVKDEYKDSNK